MTHSEIMKQAFASPEVRARIAESSRRAWTDPVSRARRLAGLLRRWKDPQYRKKMATARVKGAAKHRSRLDEVVHEMAADYQGGMSLAAVGRKYNRDRRCVADLLELRGYTLRHDGTNPNPVRLANGQIAPARPLTEKEIQRLIESATKLAVPDPLLREWRSWPMDRRGKFIRRLRDHLKLPTDRPTGPFSEGLDPFDYACLQAWDICNRLNAGTTSRTARIKLNVSSSGVIWRDQLWFWSSKVGYQRMGPWTPEEGRPSLHHTIWLEAGRRLPEDHVLIFIDGNRNNHALKNLRAVSRNFICRQNHAAALTRKSRAMTVALLKRSQRKEKNDALSIRTQR